MIEPSADVGSVVMSSSSTGKTKKKTRKIPQPRGLDFLIRNEQGRWAEDLLIDTINKTPWFRAIRYGISRAILVKGGREWAEYWEKYKKVEKHGKRPNVIVFAKDTYEQIKDRLKSYEAEYGDTSLIPEEIWVKELKLCEALFAMEVEMSLWQASKMPDKDMGLPLKKKNVIAPMIWVKEEDAERILQWCEWYKEECERDISIYVVQVFYDMAYIASLEQIINKARLIKDSAKEGKSKMNVAMKNHGLIISEQRYPDEVTGISTTKVVYRLHPAGGAKIFGYLEEPPQINVNVIIDEKGKIIPFLKFSNGKLVISSEILKEWCSFMGVSCQGT